MAKDDSQVRPEATAVVPARSNAREAREAYVRRDRQHKFKVGDMVALVHTAGVVRPKNEERQLLAARFEITRLLPEQQRSFHYRVKDSTTGQERAVAEESIMATF